MYQLSIILRAEFLEFRENTKYIRVTHDGHW